MSPPNKDNLEPPPDGTVPGGGASAASSADEDKNSRFIAIRKMLDVDIRPYVQADGGDIELVEVDGNRVKLRLLGACNTCPSSLMTLKGGVQSRLQAKISPDLVVEEVR